MRTDSTSSRLPNKTASPSRLSSNRFASPARVLKRSAPKRGRLLPADGLLMRAWSSLRAVRSVGMWVFSDRRVPGLRARMYYMGCGVDCCDERRGWPCGLRRCGEREQRPHPPTKKKEAGMTTRPPYSPVLDLIYEKGPSHFIFISNTAGSTTDHRRRRRRAREPPHCWGLLGRSRAADPTRGRPPPTHTTPRARRCWT